MKNLTIAICLTVVGLLGITGCLRGGNSQGDYNRVTRPLTNYEACLSRIMGKNPSFLNRFAGARSMAGAARNAQALRQQRQNLAVRAELACKHHL
jgi:hypothetical protein